MEVAFVIVVFLFLGMYLAFLQQQKDKKALSSFILFVFATKTDPGLARHVETLSLKTLNRHKCLLQHYFHRAVLESNFTFLEFLAKSIGETKNKAKINLCRKTFKNELAMAGPLSWSEICVQLTMQLPLNYDLKISDPLFEIVREASSNQRDAFWSRLCARTEELCLKEDEQVHARSWKDQITKECKLF